MLFSSSGDSLSLWFSCACIPASFPSISFLRSFICICVMRSPGVIASLAIFETISTEASKKCLIRWFSVGGIVRPFSFIDSIHCVDSFSTISVVPAISVLVSQMVEKISSIGLLYCKYSPNSRDVSTVPSWFCKYFSSNSQMLFLVSDIIFAFLTSSNLFSILLSSTESIISPIFDAHTSNMVKSPHKFHYRFQSLFCCISLLYHIFDICWLLFH